jgi:hypothetical protein
MLKKIKEDPKDPVVDADFGFDVMMMVEEAVKMDQMQQQRTQMDRSGHLLLQQMDLDHQQRNLYLQTYP